MQIASQRDKGSCYLIQRETHSTDVMWREGVLYKQLLIPDHRHLGILWICRVLDTYLRRLHVF